MGTVAKWLNLYISKISIALCTFSEKVKTFYRIIIITIYVNKYWKIGMKAWHVSSNERKMPDIEDLTLVVSWDQQFLNEFKKVLFSEPLAK